MRPQWSYDNRSIHFIRSIHICRQYDSQLFLAPFPIFAQVIYSGNCSVRKQIEKKKKKKFQLVCIVNILKQVLLKEISNKWSPILTICESTAGDSPEIFGILNPPPSFKIVTPSIRTMEVLHVQTHYEITSFGLNSWSINQYTGKSLGSLHFLHSALSEIVLVLSGHHVVDILSKAKIWLTHYIHKSRCYVQNCSWTWRHAEQRQCQTVDYKYLQT